MATVSRSRILFVAAALVLFLEGGTVLEAEAFVLPAGLATQRNFLPGGRTEDNNNEQHENPHQHRPVWKPLQSFKFIKGETSYGDVVEGSVNSGMLGGPSSVGFGGSASLSTNSFSRGSRLAGRRGANQRSWWASSSGFSRTTPTTLLAAGSLESWPVLEADDIQVLVQKGEDLEDDGKSKDSDLYGSSSSSVKATLERWERDISLEVVGRDGYPMLGNEMQPNSQYNNGFNDQSGSDRCTQSIKFDVADGDVYPFSGTISVPPPLTIEDSMGNKQTVMMVLNNPDENDEYQQQQYDEYGNAMPPSKPSSVEARLEPLFKSPDQKYEEAQQQLPQYDEYGNEIYNPQQQYGQYGEQKTTIPSNGSQSFQLDANDPATKKIKISLEREEGGGGGFGYGGGNGAQSSEARVEIYHGFRDQYGNPYNNNNFGDQDEDRRISLDVSTMHPSFSSVVDTMPAKLLAKHASVDNLDFVQPYLEVRIVNTGGAALKAGVQSYLPQYKPQNQKEKQKQQYQRQKYEQRQALLQQPTRQKKADDPFLLSDSAQSTTSSRRMNTNLGQESAYAGVSVGSTTSTRRASINGGASINEMWSTGSPVNNDNQMFPRPPMERRYRGSQMGNNGGGIKANFPGTDLVKDRYVQADASNVGPMIQPRVNPSYYYDDAIDTTAFRSPSNGLTASNDFSNPNPNKRDTSRTSAIVPGYRTSSAFGANGVQLDSNGIQSPSSSTTLRAFGGNSGGISGMMQPFQGRSSSQSFGRGSNDGYTTGGGLQQAFERQTSPQRTQGLLGQPSRGKSRPSSAFSGNGAVIGDGVVLGRQSASFEDSGVDSNNFVGGRSNSRFQQTLQSRNSRSDQYGGGRQSNFQSTFTPPASDNFGQDNSSGGLGGGLNSKNFLGSIKQQLEDNDSFTRDFGSNNNNNRQQRRGNGGMMDNAFGGNNFDSNSNNNSNNNSFGSSNRNSGGFGGASNSGGSPFGNMGKAPQTRGNSKNPFATLNGEATQQPQQQFNSNFNSNNSGNNNFNNNSNNSGNSFGSNNSGGAPQRAKNPFAGLNGNRAGPGGSTTAMRSRSTVNGIGDYGTTETSLYDDEDDRNPIGRFAKNIFGNR